MEKFASFKYTASSMSGHVTEPEELVMKMKSASCGPSEEDICAVMLRSLPPSYDSLGAGVSHGGNQFQV